MRFTGFGCCSGVCALSFPSLCGSHVDPGLEVIALRYVQRGQLPAKVRIGAVGKISGLQGGDQKSLSSGGEEINSLIVEILFKEGWGTFFIVFPENQLGRTLRAGESIKSIFWSFP